MKTQTNAARKMLSTLSPENRAAWRREQEAMIAALVAGGDHAEATRRSKMVAELVG